MLFDLFPVTNGLLSPFTRLICNQAAAGLGRAIGVGFGTKV